MGPLIGLLAAAASLAPAQDEPLRPKRFAIAFNAGYGGDALPEDEADFERFARLLQQAHFNVLLCTYSEARARVCRELDLQLWVDLLAPEHHVYKNVAGARALCESLRGDEVVYGYHLWSDNIGGTHAGRSRDAANVRRWDPTHPVYVGSYRVAGLDQVEGADLVGYYDFHWERGGHWGHLARISEVARAADARFLRYCDGAPGEVGAGNEQRVAHTIATSIPFGLKGYTFHHEGGVVDRATWRLDALGEDLQRVNATFAAVGDELMHLGNPSVVLSTPVTVDASDRPIEGDPAVPEGLTPIPRDISYAVTRGEVLVGHFPVLRRADVLVFAGHNAHRGQPVTLSFRTRPRDLRRFDRAAGEWVDLAWDGRELSFEVEAGSVELLLLSR